MTQNAHQAAHSALGYLYQSQWPLVELLRRGPRRPDTALTLELHDDVAFEKDGTPSELLQLKHHVNAMRGIGDMDVDLWKTVGVWMDAHPPADPDGPILSLVTTAIARDGTAAAALRAGRDIAAEALGRARLDAAATNSDNAATEDVRDRYLRLSPGDRDVFVSRVFILDGQPPAGGAVDEQIREELHWALATVAGHEDSFIEQLWGWWLGVAVGLLRSNRDTIKALDVRQKINGLADGYRPDNLPVLVRRADVSYDIEQTVGHPVFVEQIRWVAHTSVMLQHAMVDYYRAYAQRARWIDRDLIGVSELETFEENLVDEWDRAYQSMLVKLGAGAEEAAKQQAGHELLQAVSNQTVVKVRERFNDPFFMRGQLHGFSDVGRVGWHPDFEQKLKALLGQ
jgi:ABC-3C protein